MVALGIVQSVQRIDLKIQLGAVDEAAAVALGHLPIPFAQLAALLIGVRAEAEAEDHLADVGMGGRGRDHQHLGDGIVVVGRLAGLHELFRAEGDHAGGEVEHMLELIAADLHHHQVQRRVCIQRHLQALQAHAVGEVRIVLHAGARVERVFDHAIAVAQRLAHQARPAFVLGHALPRAKFRHIGGIVVAPGVGIAKDQYVFHALPSLHRARAWGVSVSPLSGKRPPEMSTAL